MMLLAELTEQTLKWVQPHVFRLEYELRAGEMIAATLCFPSHFTSLAIAESADGIWRFQRAGWANFWQTRTRIRAGEAETDLAVFKNSFWKTVGGVDGTLELADGRKFESSGKLFYLRNWEITQELFYAFKTETGKALVRYRNINDGFLRNSAEVQIYPAAKEVAETPWIVLFAWYFILIT